VKLLFDENLSPRLVAELSAEFPGSAHVHDVGLGAAADSAVWDFARDNGFVIVSKDGDFADLSVLYGAPPKIIWIRRGNCSTAAIAALLRLHATGLDTMMSGTVDRLYVIE
jgi:predicted nuclease of predicted toxin-antitoxin system